LTSVTAEPMKNEIETHKKLIDAWEIKAARVYATLLPIISERLMTYVEKKDNLAKI